MSVVDPLIRLGGQPVGDGLSRHTLTCPETCSQLSLDEPVTVLREFMHMHQKGTIVKILLEIFFLLPGCESSHQSSSAIGTRMVNEMYRGEEKVHEGIIEVWEYDQQSSAVVNQGPFQIEAGDSFRTTCYYRTENDTKFGLSSQDEMCIAFLFYYPRKMLMGRFPWFCGVGLPGGTCTADYESALLSSDDGLGRQFGDVASPIRDCSAPDQDQDSTNDKDTTNEIPGGEPQPGEPQPGEPASSSPSVGESVMAGRVGIVVLFALCCLLLPH